MKWTIAELKAMPTLSIDARHDGTRHELKVDDHRGEVWLTNDHAVYFRWINGELRSLDENHNPFDSLEASPDPTLSTLGR